MMRNFHIFILAFFAFSTPAYTQSISSKVAEVTLFSHGVQITRTASARLDAGDNQLVLKDISPFVQANSVRVTLEGAGTVRSVQYVLSSPDDKLREAALAKNKWILTQREDNLTQIRNELKVVNLEESLLQKNQVQLTGLTNYSLKLTELEEMIGLQTRRAAVILSKQFELGKQITAAEAARDSIKGVIESLKISQARPMGELLIEASAAQNTQVKLLITYFVPQAAWSPIYDVRVKDITQPVNLEYRASIYQQTGESWTNVTLKLSTADPNINNLAPSLLPWRLRYFSPNARLERPTAPNTGRFNIAGRTSANEIKGRIIDGETGEALIGASVTAVGPNTGVSTDIDGNFLLKIPPEATAISIGYIGYTPFVLPIASVRGSIVDIMLSANYSTLSEVVVSAYGANRLKKSFSKVKAEEQKEDEFDEGEAPAKVVVLPTTFIYEIDEPVTLAPDGKPLVLSIKNYDLPAHYEHFTVPKLDPHVYLTAQITSWDTLGLISGPANLFFEGTYLGKSFMEFVTVNDTLSLSLGRDQNVVVTRTKIREFSKRRFLSDQKEDSRAFELVFKNKKNAPIHLVAADQIPISTKKSMTVNATELSGADLDNETGIMIWKIDIGAGATEKRKLGYHVRYPKGKIVVLE